MSLVLWILAWTVVLLGLRAAAGALPGARAAKCLFVPGFILALLVRVAAAWLARAPIKAVNPPWREGEPVENEPPAIPVLGPLALAVLPLAAAAVAVLVLRDVLEPGLVPAVCLPDLDASLESMPRALETTGEIVLALPASVTLEGSTAAPLAIFIYLAVSVLLYAAPTVREWSWAAGFIGAGAGFIAALDWLGMRAGFFSRGWYIRRTYGAVALDAVAFLLTTALLALAAAAVARVLLTAVRSRPWRPDDTGKAAGRRSTAARKPHAARNPARERAAAAS